jgi:phosphoglycolate phosphatase
VSRSVGFDLDMTLVDTRPGIHAALLALAAETGRPIDASSIVAALGPPIVGALAPWFAPAELQDAVRRFRAHMAEVGVVDVAALPGAAAAIDAVHAAGLDVIVITSKIEPLAVATLAHAGLTVDGVFGNVWAEAKAGPLLARRAVCFVGDHPGDMVAATTAGVPAFGVTSGASVRAELLAAGADSVATSLEEFPGWLGRLAYVDHL